MEGQVICELKEIFQQELNTMFKCKSCSAVFAPNGTVIHNLVISDNEVIINVTNEDSPKVTYKATLDKYRIATLKRVAPQ